MASSTKCSVLNAWKRPLTSTTVGAMVHVLLVEQRAPRERVESAGSGLPGNFPRGNVD